MFTIFIKEQKINAPIGYYDIEKKLGVDLKVSIEVGLNMGMNYDNLDNTLNYENLVTIIRQCAEEPCNLLETYAQRILMQITREHHQLPFESIKITLVKANIPVNHYDAQGCGIELFRKF